MRKLAFCLAVAVVTAAALPVPLGAAELVVIESTAPDLKEGAVVDSTKEIKLPAGAKVTLLTAAGDPVHLDGPFAGKVPAGSKPGDPSLVGAVSRLLNPAGKDTSTVGAVRGITATAAPDPGAVDSAQGGEYCVLRNVPVRLRRGPSGSAEWARLTATKGGDTGEIAWAAGSTLAEWPAAVPQADGARYTLSRVRGQPAHITLHIEPAGLNLAQRLGWMQKQGCTEQARAVVRAIR